jgi:hypothetical protein
LADAVRDAVAADGPRLIDIDLIADADRPGG